MITTNDAEMIFNLLMLLIVAVGQFLLYRSVPPGAVNNLLSEAREASQKTAWKGDDVAVEIAEKIVTMLQGEKNETPPPAS